VKIKYTHYTSSTYFFHLAAILLKKIKILKLFYVDDARIPVGGGGQRGCDVLPRSSGQVELLQACQIGSKVPLEKPAETLRLA
jgi:hypothetical protein